MAPTNDSSMSMSVSHSRRGPPVNLAEGGDDDDPMEVDDDQMEMDGVDAALVDAADDAPNNDDAGEAEDQQNGQRKKSHKFHCTDFPPCKMSFTRGEHLARHIRKHTGERPFRCHCDRMFTRLDNLRQHSQTVHAEEYIPPDSLAHGRGRNGRTGRTERRSAAARAALRGHARSVSMPDNGVGAFSYPQPAGYQYPPYDGPHHPQLTVQTRLPPPPPPPPLSPLSPPGPHTPASSVFSQGPGSPHWGVLSSAVPIPAHWRSRSLHNPPLSFEARDRMSVGAAMPAQTAAAPHPASAVYTASPIDLSYYPNRQWGYPVADDDHRQTGHADPRSGADRALPLRLASNDVPLPSTPPSAGIRLAPIKPFHPQEPPTDVPFLPLLVHPPRGERERRDCDRGVIAELDRNFNRTSSRTGTGTSSRSSTLTQDPSSPVGSNTRGHHPDRPRSHQSRGVRFDLEPREGPRRRPLHQYTRSEPPINPSQARDGWSWQQQPQGRQPQARHPQDRQPSPPRQERRYTPAPSGQRQSFVSRLQHPNIDFGFPWRAPPGSDAQPDQRSTGDYRPESSHESQPRRRSSGMEAFEALVEVASAQQA